MSVHLESENSASVENASPGFLRFFVDGGSLKYKDELGSEFTLATGVTQEQVEDIIGALSVGGNGIDIVYDDNTPSLTFSVDESELDHELLQNIGTNSHDEIDQHIAASDNPHSVTAAQVGADPVGTGASEVAAHVGVMDPHTQYLTETKHDNLPSDNPHNVSASQVGLGNVDNTSDANKPVSTAQANADSAVQSFSINRNNHTGTQLSNTISNFETSIRNILDRTHDQNETLDTNSTSSPITRHNIDKTPQHTDDYVIRTNFVWRHSSASNDGRVEILIDGTVVRTMRMEPKDPGADQRNTNSLEYIHSATAATLFNVEVRFDAANNSNTTTMYSSNLKIERRFDV